RVRQLRYGTESKDYFWVVGTDLRLKVHPYRPDLEHTDVTDYADPEGQRLFVTMVRLAQEQGGGFVRYQWQWKDDPASVMSKTSYVKLFEPWDWVVGTGLYIEEAEKRIALITRSATCFALGILAVMLILTAWIGAVAARNEFARRRAEHDLREREERLRTIVENATEIIYTLSPEGVFLYVSPAWTRLLGHPVSAVIGHSFTEFVHPDDVAACQAFLGRIIATGEAQRGTEYRVKHASGAWRWHVSNGAPACGATGEAVYYVGLAQDITEHRKAQQQARERQEQLVQAEKLASLGTLVSGVAHEINNPNFVVMANTEILLDMWPEIEAALERHAAREGDFPVEGMGLSETRAAIRTMLDAVLDASERIRVIVDELRDYARESDAMTAQPVELNAVVRAAITLVSNLIKKSTHHFHLEYGENLPAIQGDHRRLEQVVINLIQNACQALPDKSHGLWVRTFYAAHRKAVVIQVTDEGEGIAPENMPHLMDPFFSTKRDHGGTGLGLSISAAIMEQHGGQLEFESTPGQGTTARMVLPADASSGEEQE
ncbi:MAG: cache domain-containing protein, partial [Candidatus Hydrogenedentota bacterium]